ncbi:MAG: helix-turn-helix domain-containing protein [Deltaproteobacteria bacterium]|jgi:hypothetical protein|nr:helix-turn-helix domain-containing protein [Deltaproteobacteria bacterium]
MNLAFENRLDPNRKQGQLQELSRWAGSGRWPWNRCLEKNWEPRETAGKFMFYDDSSADLTALKNEGAGSGPGHQLAGHRLGRKVHEAPGPGQG